MKGLAEFSASPFGLANSSNADFPYMLTFSNCMIYYSYLSANFGVQCNDKGEYVLCENLC